ENRVLRVGDRLTTGDLPGQPLAAVREGDHGGGDAAPFCVRDDYRVPTFHDGDAGIGGPEIDSDDFRHGLSSAGALITAPGLGKVRRPSFPHPPHPPPDHAIPAAVAPPS